MTCRDRSLVTVTTLAALYRGERLDFHLRTALDNGLSVEELVEAITHLAFYAGWPNVMSAMTVLECVLGTATRSDEEGTFAHGYRVEATGHQGAGPDHVMTHLALWEGDDVDWAGPVTDEDYRCAAAHL